MAGRSPRNGSPQEVEECLHTGLAESWPIPAPCGTADQAKRIAKIAEASAGSSLTHPVGPAVAWYAAIPGESDQDVIAREMSNPIIRWT